MAFLCIPVKKTGEVDLKKPLKTFIESNYSKEQYEAVKTAIDDVHNMRAKVVAKLNDRHESTLDVLQKYHDQLCAMESKLPISENSIRIDFKYYDAFERESIFRGGSGLKICSGAYEKMCVLFNVAALQTQVASQQSSDDNGLQTCAKLFRQAAGALSYIKDNATILCGRELGSDMSQDALSALVPLCLAQAQETVYRKAAKDKMKAAMVAKIAMYAADLYSDALRCMQLSGVKSSWPKDWLQWVASRQAGFHALAELHQADACADARHFGEQIARLRHCEQLFKEVDKRGQSAFPAEAARAKKSLETAEKDNSTIYHEQVPSANSLSAIEKAAIAKPISVSFPMSDGFKDAFERLVPMHVHQTVVLFESRRNEACQRELSRLKEATSLMQSVLTSLNLPMSLEDSDSTTVPPSLLEKARDLQGKGGLSKLLEQVNSNPELHKRNIEILDEALRMLDEEEESDKKLKEQFKDKWTRTPSERLNDKMRAEGKTFRQMLENAARADGTVQSKIEENTEGLKVLSGGESSVRSAVPSGNTGGQGGDAVKAELRRLCDEADAMKAERQVLEQQLNETSQQLPDGLASELTRAIEDSGAGGAEELVWQRASALVEPLGRQVTDQLQRQEQLLATVQQKNSDWCGGGSGATGGRQAWLTKLAKAYDAFDELQSNLAEGAKFYSDLTEVLLKYQGRVSDFCFARRTEKEELMRDLQTSLARQQPQQQAPSAPTFHATTPGTGASPPERPPPPQVLLLADASEDGVGEVDGKAGFYNFTEGFVTYGNADAKLWVHAGTKWCGAGNIASHYDDLGSAFETDACCRRHDHCSHFLLARESKYYFTNPYYCTISHCECDNDFINCLQASEDSQASSVFDGFFRLLRLPCMQLQQRWQCTAQSWWQRLAGGCSRYERRPTAVLMRLPQAPRGAK